MYSPSPPPFEIPTVFVLFEPPNAILFVHHAQTCIWCLLAANESTGTESGDHEGNNSSQPSSTEEQTNSAYQPDAGLAYQQGACVMVCTAASLSKYCPPLAVFAFYPWIVIPRVEKK